VCKDELADIRRKLNHGDDATPDEIDGIAERFEVHRRSLRPDESDEMLALVDSAGRSLGLSAPRWLCHLLDLRHRCVHVLLQWHSPRLDDVFVLQVRSWTKTDSPGQLDISVGGHVVNDGPNIFVETAYREMTEELGLGRNDLKGHGLLRVAAYESTEHRRSENFYNTEWREVYRGEIRTAGYLDRLSFTDKEVVGLYLCPKAEARQLLTQSFLPVASALRWSLPYCL
jgi:8-oxo-dGTP pyrophosphatase MutT (NUDIX family)